MSSIVLTYSISIHTHADDTNLCMGFQPVSNSSIFMYTIKTCLDEVKSHISANYLKFNVDKTKIVFYAHETKLELYRIRLQMLRRKETLRVRKVFRHRSKKVVKWKNSRCNYKPKFELQ